MNAEDIARLWLDVTVAAEAGDTQAFQLAFLRLEGAFLRASDELWETRPREHRVYVAGFCHPSCRRAI